MESMEDFDDYHPVGCGCSKCYPHLLKPDLKLELRKMLKDDEKERRQEKRE